MPLDRPRHAPSPGIALPAPDPALARHAADLAELGAWLLASCDAPLLCVALDPDRRRTPRSVVPWGRSLTPSEDFARLFQTPSHPCRSVVTGLERTADALFRLLVPRWPPFAPPRGLGVITDGTGVAFSPDDPCPLAPGWLARQMRGGGSLTVILPFAPHGCWAALTCPPSDRSVH